MKNYLTIAFPAIIGMILAYIILIMDGTKGELDYMDWGKVIAIIVALIGVAGTIYVSNRQLKRDGETITKIYDKAENIKPKMDIVDERTKETNDYLIKQFAVTHRDMLKDIETAKNNVEVISDEVKRQKAIREQYDKYINKDYLKSGIDKVYEENATLTSHIKELSIKNEELQYKTEILRSRNKNLEQENERLQTEVESLKRQVRSKERNHDIGIER